MISVLKARYSYLDGHKHKTKPKRLLMVIMVVINNNDLDGVQLQSYRFFFAVLLPIINVLLLLSEMY